MCPTCSWVYKLATRNSTQTTKIHIPQPAIISSQTCGVFVSSAQHTAAYRDHSNPDWVKPCTCIVWWVLKGTIEGLIFYPRNFRPHFLPVSFSCTKKSDETQHWKCRNTSTPQQWWRERKFMKSFWKAVLTISIKWKLSVNFEWAVVF